MGTRPLGHEAERRTSGVRTRYSRLFTIHPGRTYSSVAASPPGQPPHPTMQANDIDKYETLQSRIISPAQMLRKSIVVAIVSRQFVPPVESKQRN